MLKLSSTGSVASLRHMVCAGAALLCLTNAPAFAQLPDWAPQPPPRIAEDVVRAEVLVLHAGFDTTFRVDPSLAQRGTEISAEDDLGLDDARLLVQGELTLLPGKRHLVRLTGMAMRRSADRTIEKDIVFDDETYRVGERVSSELNLAMVGLTYGYRFVARDCCELAATLGVQVAEVEANAVVRSRVIRDAESGVAPLPLAGLEGRVDLSRRWSLEGRVQYLSANIDDVDGSITDTRIALTWRKNPHLVFGLGYRRFTIEIDSEHEDTPGFVDMTLDGPLLFMRASL